MPPGSGVPVPGANAGSSTSTSTETNVGPSPTIPTVRDDDLADPRVADVVHEEARDPALALPGELRLVGPVAAQPDLDVARGVNVPLLDQPVHRRAVRDLDAPHLRAGVGVRVEVDEPDRAVTLGAGADVGLGDRVVAAEHDRDRAGVEHLADQLLDRRVVALGARRAHRRVAEVDDAQRRERVDLGLEVAPGRQARCADRPRAEARPGAQGDEIVGRRADDRDIDPGELRRILRVGETRVGQQPGVLGLRALLAPALARVDHPDDPKVPYGASAARVASIATRCASPSSGRKASGSCSPVSRPRIPASVSSAHSAL